MRGLLMYFKSRRIFDKDGTESEFDNVSYRMCVVREGETPDSIVWGKTINDITELRKNDKVFDIELFDRKDDCPVTISMARSGYTYCWEHDEQFAIMEVWYVFMEAEPDYTL